jgi:hypothetical protein
MNILILISAILAFGALIGHLTMGKKQYLKPVMESGIDLVPKKVMQSLFHYSTVFIGFSAVILLAGSSSACPMYDYVQTMIRFIGLVYGFFALVQLIIALTSKIDGALFKLFQWIFWALICAFSLAGTLQA